jgi:hypothetical protein
MFQCVSPLDVLRKAEKHNLNQKLLKEVHAQPWQDVVGCFVPKHHDTYKIFALVLAKGSYNCKRRQYSMVFDQPDVEPINMHTSITSAEAKDQHPYIRKKSCATHHGLHRCEQIPDCGIVEVPGCVTLKMQCRIAILVKFIVWSIITNDSNSYSCVLSI